MAAPTLQQIMEALETACATISGLRHSAIVNGQISPPHLMVGVPPVEDYHGTMASGYLLTEFPITIFTSSAVDRVGQLLLAEFANPTGARSIKAAVELDKTLGGVVDDCYVTSFRPLGLVNVGAPDAQYLAGTFQVKIIAKGR
jgi:hypothetical protein